MGTPLKEGESSLQAHVETASVSHLSVKPPVFYTKSPEMWFKRMESQFVLSRITNSETKYHYIMAALPEDVSMNLVLDDSTDYDALKQAVLNSLKANKHELITQALATVELGDKKPTQVVLEMKRRFSEVGIPADDTILKSRLLTALPHSIRAALVGHENETLDKYASIADSMMAVAQISSPLPFTVGHVQSQNYRSNYDGTRPKENRRFQDNRQFKQGVRPFYEGQRPMVCNAHVFYADNARSCRHWCRWPNKPKRILAANEKTPSHSRESSPVPDERLNS